MQRQWNIVTCLVLALGLGILFRDSVGAIITLAAEAGPYLLVGFALAGFLKIIIPEQRVFRYLGPDTLTSVALASILGIPIPLCSCSVLPVATTLRQSGASRGATTSFLISTPETGLDSIGVTYALLDPIMTVARPLAALITAMATGTLVTALERLGWAGEPASGRSAWPTRCIWGYRLPRSILSRSIRPPRSSPPSMTSRAPKPTGNGS